MPGDERDEGVREMTDEGVHEDHQAERAAHARRKAEGTSFDLIESIGQSDPSQGNSWAFQFDDDTPAMSMALSVQKATAQFALTQADVASLIQWLGVRSSLLKKAKKEQDPQGGGA